MPQSVPVLVASKPDLVATHDANTVAGAVVERLYAAGIRHVIYVPGGPMMPFISTAFRSGYFRFLLCRHEQGAGFVADGLARVTRRPALVVVTAGPGVTNLVTPVYVAHREMTPLFVLSAQVARGVNGRGAAQELDTVGLLRPVTKRSEALESRQAAPGVVEQLLHEAMSLSPGPVHLSIAADQWLEAIA
jgi:acetolactate synthase I/II/III large subunit